MEHFSLVSYYTRVGGVVSEEYVVCAVRVAALPHLKDSMYVYISAVQRQD